MLFIDTETTGLNSLTATLVYIGYAIDDKPIKIINHSEGIDMSFCKLLLDKTITKVFHHANFDLLFLNRNGYKTVEPYFDTKIFYHLIDPYSPNGLKDLGHSILGKPVTRLENILDSKEPKGRWKDKYTMIGTSNSKGYGWVRTTSLLTYLRQDVSLTRHLYYHALTLGIPKYYYQLEQSLIQVILDMELRGIKIDKAECDLLSINWKEKLDSLEEYFKDLGINPRSPLQVRRYLENDRRN